MYRNAYYSRLGASMNVFMIPQNIYRRPSTPIWAQEYEISDTASLSGRYGRRQHILMGVLLGTGRQREMLDDKVKSVSAHKHAQLRPDIGDLRYG